jgi:hypothetical protein
MSRVQKAQTVAPTGVCCAVRLPTTPVIALSTIT